MLIDVHAHIYDDKYADLKEILKECELNNVKAVICASSDLESSKKSLEISQNHSSVYACIGVHPADCDNFDENAVDFLIQNASNPKVVAIGEIGLDYHYEPYDKQKQKEVFIKQLEIAHKVNLPIQVHSRDATEDTMQILLENKHLLTNGGIVHCYSGDFETLKQVEKLGLKISVGGIITFKNAKETAEIIKQAPLEMLLLETDCPYLAPTPYRGQLNKPSYIPLILNKIAEIKGVTLEELEKIIEKNTLDVFKKIKCQ